MLSNILFGAFATLGLITSVLWLIDYLFPRKQAFTSEAQLKKFFEIDKEQREEIMVEAREAFRKELKTLLDARDSAMSENLEEAEQAIHKQIMEYRDSVENGAAVLTKESLQTFHFMILTMKQYVPGFMSDLPEDSDTRARVITEIYFQINPKAKGRVIT